MTTGDHKIALDYGKIPPQAIEIEESLLGVLLMDPEASDNVLSLLPHGCFYKEAHNTIYSTIKEMYGAGKQVDILTVSEKLRSEEKIEEVGGVVYLSSLTSRVGSGAHSPSWAMVILQKYVMREAIRISSDIQEQAYDEGGDPEDIISILFNAVNDLQAILLSNQRGKSLKEAGDKSLEDYFKRKKLRLDGKTLGVKTPLKEMDKYTNGWQNGDLIILAARPSMGKTAFAISALVNAGKQGRDAVLFSIEMTATKIADRIIIGESHVDPSAYRSGTMLGSQEQAAEKILGELSELPVEIDDSPRQTIADIWGKARILKNKGKLKLLVLDYVGLVTAVSGRGKSREREVSEISMGLKQMAKDLDIPVIALSQLHRGVEARPDKRPKLSDLRESGSLEQDADVVIMLYRDEYYNPGQSPGIGEADICKNRNGNTGMVEFFYNSSLTRIYDQTDEDPTYVPYVDN